MTSESARFEPLKPPRNLTTELVERLTTEITSGKFKPNERLPTEQAMIAAFGVSRTVVREAIAVLRSEGLVETRQGSGAFVTGDMTRRPFRLDPGGLQTIEGVLHIMELRMAVEIEAAGLAAERRSKADIGAIEDSLDAFEEAIDGGGEGVEADYDFHLAVCRATKNDSFESFLAFLGRHIIPRRTVHVLRQTNGGRETYLRKVLAEHRRIHAAIAAGDSAAARRAMRSHLRKGRSRYEKLVKDTAASL